MVEPGRRCLGDRYELHRLIAAGGMGQVWRGEDIALGRPVAVKVLRSEYTGDPTFLARFRAEAQHAASLSHPNIACVFDYGEETAQDGTGQTLAYLVMELVEGEPLSTVLRRQGRLPLETTLSVLRQTAFALAEAHRAGLVHRDVKPGNILVRQDGVVKMTDFGIAWSARSVALTRTGQVIGTPQYLSPEQAEGRLATPASDVYALGLIGYECLAGQPAFDGDNAVTIALKQVRQEPEPLPADVPAGVRTLVHRSIAKDPAARLRDGAAFVAAIEDVIAGRPLPDDPVRTTSVRGAVVPPARSERALATTVTTAGGGRSPAQPPRRRLAMVVLPILGLLVGGGLAAGVLTALSGKQAPDTANAAEEVVTGVVINAGNYVGRPINDVVRELRGFDLDVQQRAVPTERTRPGLVTYVTPDGQELFPGDAVVVSYAVAVTGDEQLQTGDGGAVPSAGVQAGPEQQSTAAETTGPTTTEQTQEPASTSAERSAQSASPTQSTQPTASGAPGSKSNDGRPSEGAASSSAGSGSSSSSADSSSGTSPGNGSGAGSGSQSGAGSGSQSGNGSSGASSGGSSSEDQD